jgi:hypothetical protein
MVETYVGTRMVSESEKKKHESYVRKRQIRGRTRKVSISDVLMTLALINKRKRSLIV